MHTILICLITFVCVFGAAFLGFWLQKVVPDDHLSADAKDVVRLATGLVATMAALVLGMLVSSAKGSYDARKAEVASMCTKVILLDRQLAHYGPETQLVRKQLREIVLISIDRIWPSDRRHPSQLVPMDAVGLLYDELDDLSPSTDQQRATKAQVT